ncbi:MAG: aminopeptidase [Spirochaetales bacterium]|nr:aminopeptidase [Spirochaetales bacterium]
MKKTALRLTVCVILSWSCISCYVLRQSVPFLRHHWGARPNAKLLLDEGTSKNVVDLLTRVSDLRKFSREELGLEDSHNYTRYYELDRSYLVAVVQGAEEFGLEPHYYNYPLLGSLPYRGFYDMEQANREKKKLAKQGYDVFVRPVDAFSSLGYFKDPLFSFMVDYADHRLAELIIHEQTHATVFITGEAEFNEKLATLVGREGAAQYIVSRFGSESKENQMMGESRLDSDQFALDMYDLSQKLTAVYTADISDDQKRTQKREVIGRFKAEFISTYEARYSGDGYRDIAAMEINNAFISLFRLYQEPEGRLDMLLSRTGNIGRMIELLRKELEEEDQDPWDAVDRIINRAEPWG